MKHVLLVAPIMASWQLLHFDSFMHGYMLLAFKNPSGAQCTTRAMSIINIEEECRLENHIECSSTQVPANQNKCNINYHHHNGFMVTGTLGHIHSRSHFACI